MREKYEKMDQFSGQLKNSQKLTNLTRLITELLENDPIINLEFMCARKEMKIGQMLFWGI